MNKRLKARLSFFGICLFVLFCCSPTAYAVDGSKQTPYNGHLCEVSGSTKQVCANCHIPHAGKGARIWARGEVQGKQTTVKDLCASCHYQGNKDFPQIESGLRIKGTGQYGGRFSDLNNANGNVFLGGSANHVMGARFQPNADGGTSYISTTEGDGSREAEVIGFPFSKTEGFYCGSCHNPHKQPNKDESGHGDYLRLNSTTASAGETHDRRQFCRQCHPKASKAKDINGRPLVHIHSGEATDPQCEACHRPHDGYHDTQNPENDALIFIDKLEPLGIFTFGTADSGFKTVLRNAGASSVIYESQKCTSCHLSTTTWPNAPKLQANRAHHPLGQRWAKTSCGVSGCHEGKLPGNGLIFKLDGSYADGSSASFDQQIFGCTSCHGAHTSEIEGNPSFLRYASFKDDDTALCEYCHNDPKHPKSRAMLEANGGLHFKTRTDPKNRVTRTFKATSAREEKVVKCGGCMFCHFIHSNDKDDPRDIKVVSPLRADIDALMRVPAKELNWGSQGDIALSPDPLDRYEAMCYGCHGNSNIVGSYEKNGSLLNTAGRQSHRFACKPVSSNTRENIISAGGVGVPKFLKADGKPGSAGGVMDDYGTVEGQIFCGTCHDVHINTKPPYLYRLSENDKASPYEANGYCEQCHCTATNPDPMAQGTTHPVGADKVPNGRNTCTAFPKQFYGGKSGSPLGITAGNNTATDGVLCLTCHNVHAAATAWDGTIAGEQRPAPGQKGKHGQLLVQDNYSEAPGSNMCRACHDQF